MSRQDIWNQRNLNPRLRWLKSTGWMAHGKPYCCLLSRELFFRSSGPAKKANAKGWAKLPPMTTRICTLQCQDRTSATNARFINARLPVWSPGAEWHQTGLTGFLENFVFGFRGLGTLNAKGWAKLPAMTNRQWQDRTSETNTRKTLDSVGWLQAEWHTTSLAAAFFLGNFVFVLWGLPTRQVSMDGTSPQQWQARKPTHKINPGPRWLCWLKSQACCSNAEPRQQHSLACPCPPAARKAQSRKP